MPAEAARGGLQLPKTVQGWTALVTAMTALLAALGGTGTNLAGLWSFPEIVTRQVLNEELDRSVTEIVERLLHEHQERAVLIAELEFELRTARTMLEKLEEPDDRALQEQVIRQIEDRLAALREQ